MSTVLWRRVRGGGPGARVFAACVALVLAVAIVSPGVVVYAAEGEAVEATAPPEVVAPVEEAPETVPDSSGEDVVTPPPADAPEEAAPSADVPVELDVPEAAEAAEPLIDEAVAAPEAAAPLQVEPMTARPICEGGVKLDNNPRTGTYTWDTPGTEEAPGAPLDYSITITTYMTDDGMMFDFVSNYPVASIGVKGTNAYEDYTYDPPVYSGTGLHAPMNESSGYYADISHIIFCFGEIEEPETGDLMIHKFLDENENGLYDEGEEMLSGWEFEVTRETPPLEPTVAAIELVGTGFTDENGELGFTGLLPDTYTIRETMKEGWYSTTGAEETVVVVAGETTHVWFGNVPDVSPPETGDLVVHKFYDENENGLYDEGEAMLPDWAFTLYDSAGVEIGSDMTDQNGYIVFDDLKPGDYSAAETLQEGWVNTTDLEQDVTVISGETVHLWFGNIDEALPFTEIDLVITKKADVETAEEGDIVTYTITWWNDGATPAEDYTIVDDFDERYVTVIDAAGGTVAGGKITWTFAGPLAKEDGKQTATYKVRINAEMPDGTTNVDNVVVIAHPDDIDLTNNTDDDRVVVRTEFLPFTGGEYLLLLGLALLALIAGGALRLGAVRIT